MAISPVSAITRAATRRPDEKLNILTWPTHERYETNLAKTGHNFFSYQGQEFKSWNTQYAPVPDNYRLLDGTLGAKQVPLDIDFDLILSQNKWGQFQVGYQLSKQLHLPLISLEHTLPIPTHMIV